MSFDIGKVKGIVQSKYFRKSLWIGGILATLLLVFAAGQFVGFHRASFSYRWGENYYRNFTGHDRDIRREVGGRDLIAGHGVFGSIVTIASTSLVIQGQDGIEKIITLAPDTVILRFRDRVDIAALKAGDTVVVIGTPMESGQIEARLIRMIPSPPGGMPLRATGTPR